MSLEEEAWKTDGRPASPRLGERPPTIGDRIARTVATLILLLIATFSVWVFSLILPAPAARPVTIVLLATGILVVVWLLFKTRDLRTQLALAQEELSAQRRERQMAASATSPTERPISPPNP